jgi:dipeptidase D
MDINLGRGNANLLMNRILYAGIQVGDLRISELNGGSLRNAIPRESHATIVVPNASKDAVIAQLKKYAATVQKEYYISEPNMKFVAEPNSAAATKMISKADQEKAIRAIYTTPNAVWKMSETISGLVETSSSLAKVVFKDGQFTTQSLQRSMVESGKEDIANAIRLTYELIGAKVTQDGSYPGWTPNPDSKILKVLEKHYVELFKDQPKVKACHAGLECGILGEHLPNCDMISFGPTIKNPHSPDEKVNIQSVQKFWSFLTKVLENIPAKN